MSTTQITVRDRVVDAIARATHHVKAGNALPYTIAFVAEEPACIIRVKAIRTNLTTGESFAFYQIDGNRLQRMEHSVWSDLYREMINGPSDDADQLQNDIAPDNTYGDDYTIEGY